MEPIRIKLTLEQITWTDENVGKKRQENARQQNRTPRWGQSVDQSAIDDILGARCEAAAYTWAKPVKWHWFHFGRETKPDLHDFIDVKGVDKPHYNLIVREENDPAWAYLLVDGTEHPFYDIIGWCWGFEAKTVPLDTRGTDRDPCHFVDRDSPLMKDPELLKLVLRERQEFPERAIALRHAAETEASR